MFGKEQGQSLLLYLDDIIVIVFSSSVEQHLQRLGIVLGRLQKEGLKAKLEKCAFFRREVGYLGHVITSQGVFTDPKKIEAVSNWQRPRHISELRSFLGFASYYRRFVAWMPDKLSPAHNIFGREVRSGIAPLGKNYDGAKADQTNQIVRAGFIR